MIALLQKGEAEQILAPYLDTLEDIMTSSLSDLNTCMRSTAEPWNLRAKSTTLHSFAVNKAKRHWGEHDYIAIRTKYQSLQIVFDKKLVGRIKKVNKENLSSNIKTGRNDSILRHQLKLFAEITPLTFIDIGYRVDPTWTIFETLVIVCRYGDTVKWIIPINNRKSGTGITTIPTAPIAPTVREEKQIKIKRAI